MNLQVLVLFLKCNVKTKTNHLVTIFLLSTLWYSGDDPLENLTTS
jgi:hypothetical protein